MSEAPQFFHFDHIPLNVDKQSIKAFLHSKDTFAYEVSVFEPKTVHVCMIPVVTRWRREKNRARGMASIQQFASAMGLHPDFHTLRLQVNPTTKILTIVEPTFPLGENDDGTPYVLHSGGLLILPGKKNPPFTNVTHFLDGVLEILTEDPIFFETSVSEFLGGMYETLLFSYFAFSSFS